jgi:hypothetical protein
MSVFTSQANKTALQNVAQKASGAVNNLLSSNLGQIGVAALMTNKMVQSGISALTTGAAVAASLDNLISGSSSAFGANSPMRTTIDSLNDRNKAGDSSSNPETQTAASKSSTTGGTDLSYPPVPAPYHIAFRFLKYKRPEVMGNTTYDALETIILPMPDQLVDQLAPGWSETPLGMAGLIANSITNVDAFTAPGSGKNVIPEALLYVGANLAPGEFVGAASSLLGAVPNPAASQLFQGVGFRRHSFSWTFAAKNADESARIKEIIKKIKMHSLPTYTSSTGAFFNYPDIVQPEFRPTSTSGSSFPDLYSFKKCVIKECNVNYAPQSTPAFFLGTGAPVLIQLSISLDEMEYLTQEDYGGNKIGENVIGKAKELINRIKDQGTGYVTGATKEFVTGGE